MIQNNYTNALELDKNRYRVKYCPCGKSNNDGKFVPYIGYEDAGYCHSCGKTITPFSSGGNMVREKIATIPKHQQPMQISKPVDYILLSHYISVLNQYKHLYPQCNFIQWLGNPQRGNYAFKMKQIEKLVELYLIGVSGKTQYAGWVLFPYININGRVTDIKAMDYNPDTGKRIKEPINKCKFIGKEVLKNPNANTIRCFYGEHLLRGNTKPVMLFESEATATYAALFFPDYACLATGGNNGCRWTDYEKCKVLQSKKVVLYPDIDAHDSWLQKASLLRSYGIDVSVSEILKTNAIQHAKQNNLAYETIVGQKFDLRDFLQYKPLVSCSALVPAINAKENSQPPVVIEPTTTKELTKANWNEQITDLELFFKNYKLPSSPIKISRFETITDPVQFVQNHLLVVNKYNGNAHFKGYLDRLINLKTFLINNST